MRDTQQEREIKSVDWVGSSRRDLGEFPETVQDKMVYALEVAQEGDKHPKAKPLKGKGLSGVMEIRINDVSGTYRAMYTTKIGDKIYVLHAFQKKPKGVAKHRRQKSISSNAD